MSRFFIHLYNLDVNLHGVFKMQLQEHSSSCRFYLKAIDFRSFTIHGVSKKCPKWKIASTSDISQNLGHFLQPRVIRSLLVYTGHKITFPSKFMLPGGCFLSSNFEMACAQKCQPENGMFFNWLQV